MDESDSSGTRIRPAAVAGALLAVAVALAVGVFVGIASHGNDANAAAVNADSVDVGFARDMRDHHAQAVEMSVLVREATTNPQVRTLALDILLTQQQQVGQMYGWLATWDQPQTSPGEPMTWMSDMAEMDHETMSEGQSGAGGMPGMATDEQLQQLEQASGKRAERAYLQLMIPHHEAGVTMAEYAVENATEPQVRSLAQSIVNSQTAELDVLRSMLDARGGPLTGL